MNEWEIYSHIKCLHYYFLKLVTNTQTCFLHNVVSFRGLG